MREYEYFDWVDCEQEDVLQAPGFPDRPEDFFDDDDDDVIIAMEQWDRDCAEHLATLTA